MQSKIGILNFYEIQFSQHHLLRRFPFLKEMFLAPFPAHTGFGYMDLCLGFLCCSGGQCVCFQPCCFGSNSLVACLEILHCNGSSFILVI